MAEYRGITWTPISDEQKIEHLRQLLLKISRRQPAKDNWARIKEVREALQISSLPAENIVAASDMLRELLKFSLNCNLINIHGLHVDQKIDFEGKPATIKKFTSQYMVVVKPSDGSKSHIVSPFRVLQSIQPPGS